MRASVSKASTSLLTEKHSGRHWSAVFLLAALTMSCDSATIDSSGDCDFEGPSFEARSWLGPNESAAPLASNRFPRKASAVAFVDSLYSAGADSVFAVDVWDDDDGGTYTASLLVFLPQDAQARSLIFAIEAREARRGGFAPTADAGQSCLLLWWD